MANQLPDILQFNPVGAYMQGQQFQQGQQSAAQENQLRAMQMQQAQQGMQRDQQFRNELATYLQGGSDNLAALYAADPERAMQVQQFQVQQNQLARQKQVEDAKRNYATAQYVLQSKSPKALAESQLPQLIQQLKESGVDWDSMTDDDVRGLAEQVAARSGSQAGIAPEKPPETVQTLEALSKNPELLATDIARRRASAQQVNVNTKQETQEAKTVGEEFGKQYATLLKAGSEAPAKLSRLDRMEQLMEGVETGKLTPATTQIASIAEALGFKVDAKLGAKQALEALSNEIALQLRNPSGGAGMPGAMSDKDREFLGSMTPGLAKTKAGNKLIIETARKLTKRDGEVAKLARDYRKKNGSLDEGFYDELAEYSASHPLFGTAEEGVTVTKDGWIIREKP